MVSNVTVDVADARAFATATAVASGALYTVPQAAASSKAARVLVEDAVGLRMQECDPQQLLRAGDFQDVLEEVTDKVLHVMKKEERAGLDEEDRQFIWRRVRKMVNGYLSEYDAERSKPTRFTRAERVVCRVGGAPAPAHSRLQLCVQLYSCTAVRLLVIAGSRLRRPAAAARR